MRVAGALALATIAAAGLVAGTAGTATAASSHHVVYEVWGDAATASVLWFDGDNDITDGVTETLPARIELDNDSTYPAYGVNAQTDGKGNISCRITVDGIVRDEQTARGKFAVVGCNAA